MSVAESPSSGMGVKNTDYLKTWRKYPKRTLIVSQLVQYTGALFHLRPATRLSSYLFAYWVIFFACFCCLLIFSKSISSKISFGNTIRVSNSLDPDQARRFVGPDLGPNCLQKLPVVAETETNIFGQKQLHQARNNHPIFSTT